MKALLALLSVTGFLLISCQSKPTKVFDSVEARVREGEKAKVTPQHVIVDARPTFEFSISNVPGSVNLRAEEFTQPQEPFRGLFEADLFFHTRKLARMGIGPDTPVIVVGRGPQGNGEEGRLAWTLMYLGVKDVSFMHIDAFDRGQLAASTEPRKPVAIWKPNLDETLIVSREDFLKKVNSPRVELSSPVIMDVRPTNEYLGKVPGPFRQPPPDLGATNVPWTEFITSKGLSRPEIKEQLEATGIVPTREIYVISNRGVESATVTLILRKLGYSKAANYAGGYAELIGTGK